MAVTDGRRDTGIGTGKLAAIIGGATLHIILRILVVLIIVGFAMVMLFMYRDQERKLNELAAEKQQMQDRLDELAREKERLESKLQYTQSLEGLLQYARNNLGYVFPDDTRYDDNGD